MAARSSRCSESGLFWRLYQSFMINFLPMKRNLLSVLIAFSTLTAAVTDLVAKSRILKWRISVEAQSTSQRFAATLRS
jgi:hypothetical protein